MLAEDNIYEFTPALCQDIAKYLAEGADPDELLHRQHTEYILAVKEILDNNTTKKAIWGALKEKYDQKDVALDAIPLSVLKRLYVELTE
jgi:hypothetical protein